jgi:histidinol-phosphate aminotransferase
MKITRRHWLEAGGLAFAASLAPATARTQPVGRARLSLNENPFGPSPLAIHAIRDQTDRLCRYVGDDAALLTNRIAANEDISSDKIVLGEILDVLGLQLALDGGAGSEFIYSEPGYTALVDAVAPGGGVVVGVPLDRRLQNDLSAIASKINARTRAIYIVNPHNPSGTVTETSHFKAFLTEVSRRATVIVDEAYLEFEPDFADRSAIDLVRAGKNVVVFRTFAKIYGLAGLSMGYAVAPTELAGSLKRKGVGEPHTLNRLAIAAAGASLRDAGFVTRTRAKVIEERDKWNALFDRRHINHADSRGNFVFFETGRPHDVFAAALLSHGIEIARGFPPLDQWARISIGLPEENMLARRAVERVLSQ